MRTERRERVTQIDGILGVPVEVGPRCELVKRVRFPRTRNHRPTKHRLSEAEWGRTLFRRTARL
jgi:hypothetical protein